MVPVFGNVEEETEGLGIVVVSVVDGVSLGGCVIGVSVVTSEALTVCDVRSANRVVLDVINFCSFLIFFNVCFYK